MTVITNDNPLPVRAIMPVVDHFDREGGAGGVTSLTTATVRTVASLTSSGTTATLTTSAAHGIAIGTTATWQVYGATPAGYNGVFTVTATTTTAVTYTIVSVSDVAATGTVTVTHGADYTSSNLSGAGLLLGSPTMRFPFALYVEAITITSNKNLVMAITGIGNSSLTGLTNFAADTPRIVVTPSAPVVIPVRRIVRPGLVSTTSYYLNQIIDADRTNTFITVSWTAKAILDDPNFNADKPILFVGDSIWAGYAGTSMASFNPRLIRKYYSDKGLDVRMMGQPTVGSTLAGHTTYRDLGGYDISDRPFAAIFVNLGINDVTAGTSAATFQTQVADWIAWKQREYPNAEMVFFGATPLTNNTNETALALLRTAASDAVTAAADAKIKYCSLASPAPFDRTSTGNYNNSDGIHPNEASMLAVYNTCIEPFLDTDLPTL